MTIIITIIVIFDHFREAEEICNKCECDIRDYGKHTCTIQLLMRMTMVKVMMMMILMVMIMLMLMVMVMVIIQREEDLQDGMQL